MSDDGRQAELAAILADGPDHLGFRALRTLIATWPVGRSREEAVADALSGLKSWPDERRRVKAPWSNLEALLASPAWPLVRSLHLDLDDGDTDQAVEERRVEVLAGRPELRSLRELKLIGDTDGRILGLEGMAALTDSPHLLGLDILHLQGFASDAATLGMLAGADFLSNLVGLTLFDMEFGEIEPFGERWTPLFKTGRFDRLKHLGLESPTITDLQALVDSGFDLQSLTFLGLTAEGLEVVLGKGDFAGRIRELDLTGCAIGGRGAASLANTPDLGRLRKLDLSSNNLGPSAVGRLVQAEFAARLIEFNLSDNPLRDEGWRALAAGDFRALEDLNLNDTVATDVGLKALAGSATLGSLRRLNLGGNQFSTAGGAALAGAPWWPGLEGFSAELGQPGLGDEGAAAILATCGSGLRSLNLGYVGLGKAGATALAKAPPRLRHLILSGNVLDASSIESLASSGVFESVRYLELSGCKLDDEAILALSRAAAPSLRALTMISNAITAEGFRFVGEAPWASGLRTLDLCANPAGPAGAAALASSTRLRNLVELGVGSCGFDAEAERNLLASPVAARLDAVEVEGIDDEYSRALDW